MTTRAPVLFVALLVGCGSGATGAAVAPVAIADFVSSFDKATCDWQIRCGVYGGDEASCLVFYGKYADFGGGVEWGNDIAAAAAGKVMYDANEAGHCIDAAAAAPCDAPTTAACAQVFTGNAALDVTCELDEECASGYCLLANQGTGACTFSGTCASVPLVGEACTAGAGCGSNASCDGTECQPLTAKNGVCGIGFEPCGAGLYCVLQAGTTGLDAGVEGVDTCQPAVAEGQSCVDNPNCLDSGDYCNSQSKTCVRVGLLGDACNVNDAADDCAQGLYCGPALTCIVLPTLGQPCTTKCSDASYCALDTTGMSGTCTALAPDGTACTTSKGCVSDYCAATKLCADSPICI